MTQLSTSRMFNKFTSFSLGFLIFTVMLTATPLSSHYTYLLIISSYLFILIVFFSNKQIKIGFKKEFMMLFALLSLIIFSRTVLEPQIGDILRLGSLLTFTVINIFVIPRVFRFREVLTVSVALATAVVTIGYLPLLGTPIEIGPFDLTTWRRSLIHPELPVVTSIFIKPNHLGFISLVGALSSVELYHRNKNNFLLIVFVINLFATLFSDYRAGWLALGAALVTYILYLKAGRRVGVLAVFGGLFANLFIVLVVGGYVGIPGVGTISTNRVEVWQAGIQQFSNNWLLGTNFTGITVNPHNSYLRMFVAFGIAGGLVYIFLVIKSTIEAAREATTHQKTVLAMMIFSFSFIQSFNQLTFIGISMRSTFIAIALGYYASAAKSK